MPVRITRVYTRSGDHGETRLAGGTRVRKDSPRIEAYGAVDELNAVLGLARAHCAAGRRARRDRAELERILRALQNELFELGADLATAPEAGRPAAAARIDGTNVRRLEALIDRCQEGLPRLDSFVLPGGGEVSAALHLARTVCRRAEREVVRLGRSEAVGEWTLKYLNRLSDLLFVLARWIAHRSGETEELWEQRRRPAAAPGGRGAKRRPVRRSR